MLLLNSEDIKRCVDLPNLIRKLEAAYKGFVSTPPVVPQRSVITHQRQKAFSLFMPAFMPESRTLGIKVSSFFPGNTERGLPSINGAIMLIDVETGQLLAMLDSGALTALRTSAMSALATDKLCPHERLNLAVIGAGVQASAHIKAMAAIRKIGWVKVFSRRYVQCSALVDLLSVELSLPVAAVDSIEKALFDADIVCTTTSHDNQRPLILTHQLKPSVHVNAIGGSTAHACEIDPQILVDAQVYVDHLDAARRESGEITQALVSSMIVEADIQEISALVFNHTPIHKKGRSYFRSVGQASQDMVISAYIYAVAIERHIGKHCNYLST